MINEGRKKSSGTLFIQPHSDDMAMSSFYAIKSNFFEKPYYLLTVFSTSGWIDPVQNIFINKKAKKTTVLEITKRRKKEDRAFAGSLNLKIFFGNLEDSGLRHGKAIFNQKASVDKNDISKVEGVVNKFLSKNRPKNVVFHFPSGAVQHVDHRIVFNVCKNLKDNNLYLVDDFPYSKIRNADIKKMKLEPHLFKIRNIYDKLVALSTYNSQACSYFFEQVIGLTSDNFNSERVFKLNNSYDKRGL